MAAYCPKRGDIVWLSFTPQAGHEQAGHRPALVLSPESYNRKVGLALFCPITSQDKGYPFEVRIPQGYEVSGVVLADQVKSLDWKARRATFCCELPAGAVHDVLNKLGTLTDEPVSSRKYTRSILDIVL
ncbi:MAG: endoribonuclease MazF [bacterium]|jgi:mRNA interferase MazF